MKIFLSFDSVTWEQIDPNHVIRESFYIEDQIHQELRPTISVCKFQLKTGATLVNQLLGAVDDIQVRVTDDSDVRIFTGFIRKQFAVQLNGKSKSPIDVEVVDQGYLLKKPIKRNLYLKDQTVSGIALALLDLAGIPAADLPTTTVSTVVTHLFVDGESNHSIESVLAELLYEHGYVYHADQNGKFKLVEMVIDSPVSTWTFNDSNTFRGEQVDRHEDNIDSIEIKYPIYETRSDSIVFNDTTGGNNFHTMFVTLAPGEYYPKGSSATDVVYSRFTIEDGAIIRAENPVIDFRADPGIVLVRSNLEEDQADIAFRNDSGSPQSLQRYQIKADAVIKVGDGVVTVDGGTNDYTRKISARFLDDEVRAEQLANYHYKWTKNSSFKYKLGSPSLRQLGEIVRIQNAAIGLDSLGRIQRRYISQAKPNTIEYIIEGVGQFTSGINISDIGWTIPVLPPGVITSPDLEDELADYPTFEDLDDQLNPGGADTWKEIPPDVTGLTASVIGTRIILSWNLPEIKPFSFAGYRIYRRKGSSGSFEMIGDSFGGFTDTVVLDLENDLAIPTLYEYQVRGRNISGTLSENPTEVPAVGLPIQSGDFAARAVTRAAIEAGFIDEHDTIIKDLDLNSQFTQDTSGIAEYLLTQVTQSEDQVLIQGEQINIIGDEINLIAGELFTSGIGSGSKITILDDSITTAVGRITTAEGEINDIQQTLDDIVSPGGEISLTGITQNREAIELMALQGRYINDGTEMDIESFAQFKIHANKITQFLETGDIDGVRQAVVNLYPDGWEAAVTGVATTTVENLEGDIIEQAKQTTLTSISADLDGIQLSTQLLEEYEEQIVGYGSMIEATQRGITLAVTQFEEGVESLDAQLSIQAGQISQRVQGKLWDGEKWIPYADASLFLRLTMPQRIPAEKYDEMLEKIPDATEKSKVEAVYQIYADIAGNLNYRLKSTPEVTQAQLDEAEQIVKDNYASIGQFLIDADEILMKGSVGISQLNVDQIVADQGFINKLIANEAFINTLVTDELFSQNLKAGSLLVESEAFQVFIDEENGFQIRDNSDTILGVDPVTGNAVFRGDLETGVLSVFNVAPPSINNTWNNGTTAAQIRTALSTNGISQNLSYQVNALYSGVSYGSFHWSSSFSTDSAQTYKQLYLIEYDGRGLYSWHFKTWTAQAATRTTVNLNYNNGSLTFQLQSVSARTWSVSATYMESYFNNDHPAGYEPAVWPWEHQYDPDPTTIPAVHITNIATTLTTEFTGEETKTMMLKDLPEVQPTVPGIVWKNNGFLRIS